MCWLKSCGMNRFRRRRRYCRRLRSRKHPWKRKNRKHRQSQKRRFLRLRCQDSGEGTLAEEEPDPEVFAAEIVREGEETQQFQTLREAVMAAQTGDMIRLLDDCEETVQISMNSKKNTPTQLTFDLNGHAIDGKGEKRCIVGIQANSATDRCTLTVKNGTLKNGAAGKGVFRWGDLMAL